MHFTYDKRRRYYLLTRLQVQVKDNLISFFMPEITSSRHLVKSPIFSQWLGRVYRRGIIGAADRKKEEASRRDRLLEFVSIAAETRVFTVEIRGLNSVGRVEEGRFSYGADTRSRPAAAAPRRPISGL